MSVLCEYKNSYKYPQNVIMCVIEEYDAYLDWYKREADEMTNIIMSGHDLTKDMLAGYNYLLSTLSERDRKILELYFCQNVTIAECSSIVNTSTTTCRSAIDMFLKKISSHLLFGYIVVGLDRFRSDPRSIITPETKLTDLFDAGKISVRLYRAIRMYSIRYSRNMRRIKHLVFLLDNPDILISGIFVRFGKAMLSELLKLLQEVDCFSSDHKYYDYYNDIINTKTKMTDSLEFLGIDEEITSDAPIERLFTTHILDRRIIMKLCKCGIYTIGGLANTIDTEPKTIVDIVDPLMLLQCLACLIDNKIVSKSINEYITWLQEQCDCVLGSLVPEKNPYESYKCVETVNFPISVSHERLTIESLLLKTQRDS